MDPQVFGTFVQQRRKELSMSQAELAEKLHVTAKAVSRWERGVGFPDIKLLQPLADGLQITIVELMQSRLIETDLPKEAAAELVSDTVNTIHQQEELSRKRKLILYAGKCLIFAVYCFLYMLGRLYDFEPRWLGAVLVIIALFVWHWGSRALHCLLTGDPFFVKVEYTKQARIAQAVLILAMTVLVGVTVLFQGPDNHWRDLVVILCLTAVLGSAMLMNETE